MKNQVNFLIERILRENTYSIEDIQKAIDTNTPITLSKEKEGIVSQYIITPTAITGDFITGESEDLGIIEFDLEDVEKINFLDEAGIKTSLDTVAKMDVSKLEKIAQKADITITEEEEFLESLRKSLIHEEEEQTNPQELAIFNVKNWATQLELPISDVRNYGQGVKQLTFIEDQRQYTVLIYPDGGIRLSNRTVRTFNDFKNIIEFHKNL